MVLPKIGSCNEHIPGGHVSQPLDEGTLGRPAEGNPSALVL